MYVTRSVILEALGQKFGRSFSLNVRRLHAWQIHSHVENENVADCRVRRRRVFNHKSWKRLFRLAPRAEVWHAVDIAAVGLPPARALVPGQMVD